jgi:hypothetical protein
MQETWRFDIGPMSATLPDEELLRELLLANKQDLGIFLSYYFRKVGAVAEEPEIFDTIQSKGPNKGHFELAFRLVYFNACLNIHEFEKDKMQINYWIDRESAVLELTGPYWPERGMDEI